MKSFNFDDCEVFPDKICLISKVMALNTGQLGYEREYGFTVLFDGGPMHFISASETDELGNHLKPKEERFEAAKRNREKFLKMIEDTKE